MPNVATLDDAAITALHGEAEQQAATLMRQRVVTRLATALLVKALADCPAPPPTTEHQVRAVLQTLSDRLEQSSQALFYAADRLKRAGDGYGSGHVYAAAQAAQLAAKAMG